MKLWGSVTLKERRFMPCILYFNETIDGKRDSGTNQQIQMLQNNSGSFSFKEVLL